MGVCKFWKSLSICNKLDTVLSAVVGFGSSLFSFLVFFSQLSEIVPPRFCDVSMVCH